MPPQELTAESLRRTFDPSSLPFETTAEVEPLLTGIIGQERAVRAAEFGLRVKKRGYNLYFSGLPGLGKTSYAQAAVQHIAALEASPPDWCYVYNFQNPNMPRALSLPAGKGSSFQKDMEELIEELKVEIPRAFSSEDYEKQKNALFREFQEKSSALMEELNLAAAAQGFILKRSSTGFVTIPVVEGKPTTQEEFDQLDPAAKEALERKSTELQFKAMEIMRRVQNIEKEMREKIRELEGKIGLFAVGHRIAALKEKYVAFPQVVSYLDAVQEDVLANLEAFRPEEEQNIPFPGFRRQTRAGFFQKYTVNLLVNNQETKGAPVIIEDNPSYYNLVGRIEYQNEWGFITTNFTMIKAGALHRANGGYLILQAKDVLANFQSWEALKRVLKTERLTMENLGEQYGLVALASLKPEPIPLDVKVVLIGSPLFYYLLYNYDEDFRKLFKVKVDFDVEMTWNEKNVLSLAKFISTYCQREGLRHFHRTGVAKVIEQASRLAENKEKLTTCFNEIVELLYEADAWAGAAKASFVTSEHVVQAIKEKKHRSNRYEEKLQELFAEGSLLLDTEGEVPSQINGLSVVELGDDTFGRPTRITAMTFPGEDGVVNIERETKLSGAIHNKGVLVLSGYLGAQYAREAPLTLSASICFEQLYEGIEGDSASSTELYALLSSLADLPINQGIAVTGSVNQRGEIQPVGGVTAKVEGFFKVCKLKGLNGKQGVIIPAQNVKNLMLDEEVITAVSEGKFHIYPVKTIDEGIEILTGVPAGTRDENGNFPPGTVHFRVAEKLKHFQETVTRLGKEKKPDQTRGN